MTRLATRLEKLEAAILPCEPQPETGPHDLDALLVRLKQHQAEGAAIHSDPDPMRRYRYWLAEVERDEQASNATGLAAGKVDTASRIAALSLPISRYHLRAAESELLHTGYLDRPISGSSENY
mgnify:CR=1 FL=1